MPIPQEIHRHVQSFAQTGWMRCQASSRQLARETDCDAEGSRTARGRSEVVDGTQALLKDLRDLQLRNGEDVAGTVTSPDPSGRSVGMSKFDRLPRIALPNFDGTAIGWRPFWEKFQNAITKDVGLTDVDRLAFLIMSVKGEEARQIIKSMTRAGLDFDGAVKALQDRYDQPRQTCRTALQSVISHAIDLSAEGISKTITLFQTSLAVVKECTDATLDTFYTVLCELIMPETMFQNWAEESSKLRKTPGFEYLADYLRRYQMRFCAHLIPRLHHHFIRRGHGSRAPRYMCSTPGPVLSVGLKTTHSICVTFSKDSP